MNKLRKGDEVIVITGKDKGKRGQITARVSDELVLVAGINTVKKHQKPNPMKGEEGGIIDKQMPIQQSNLAIFNAKTASADRVGIQVAADGKKTRIFRSNGEAI